MPMIYIMLCEQQFGVCRLGFTFLVFETPLPFSIFKQPTPHSFFFKISAFKYLPENIKFFLVGWTVAEKFHHLVKKLDSSQSSQKKFVIPYLFLKLSLTLPYKGKMNIFTPKCHFLTILWKKLDSSWSYQKKIFGFPYLSLKLSLTLPHKGKMLWCSYFRSFIKLTNFSRTGIFI